VSAFVDVLLATRPDGERIFSDAAVDHALPLVLLMVAFPMDQLPPRAQAAFTRTLAEAGVAAADDTAVMGTKIGAYYQKVPVEPALMDAMMSWLRQELRDNAGGGGVNKAAIAAKLGLDSPKFVPPSPKPAGAVSANPMARFSLGADLPKKKK
jgi:hypothetical protein